MSIKSWERTSRSEADTAAIGEALGEVLTAGLVVALIGNLGAGKTRFVQGIAAGLGADPGAVTSPTFVLIHEYQGRLRMFHFDAYRLDSVDEFLDLGAEELFYSDGVCLVEWADRVEITLPLDHLRVNFVIASPTDRQLQFTATGRQSQDVLESLRSHLEG